MGGQERKNYARWDEFSGVNPSNQLGEGVGKKSVGKLDPLGKWSGIVGKPLS